MRSLILIVFMMQLTTCVKASEYNKFHKELGQEIKKQNIILKIKHVSNTRIELDLIAQGVVNCKEEINIVLSIIKIESDFDYKAFNDISVDYGLMQISDWHVRRSKLSTRRLMNDIKYNIKEGCRILSWFIKTYNKKEAVVRYNVGTKKNKNKSKIAKKYWKKFNSIYKKLNEYDKKL